MTRSCEACETLYETVRRLREFGAKVDLVSYQANDSPMLCKNGHLITEVGLMERQEPDKK